MSRIVTAFCQAHQIRIFSRDVKLYSREDFYLSRILFAYTPSIVSPRQLFSPYARVISFLLRFRAPPASRSSIFVRRAECRRRVGLLLPIAMPLPAWHRITIYSGALPFARKYARDIGCYLSGVAPESRMSRLKIDRSTASGIRERGDCLPPRGISPPPPPPEGFPDEKVRGSDKSRSEEKSVVHPSADRFYYPNVFPSALNQLGFTPQSGAKIRSPSLSRYCTR